MSRQRIVDVPAYGATTGAMRSVIDAALADYRDIPGPDEALAVRFYLEPWQEAGSDAAALAEVLVEAAHRRAFPVLRVIVLEPLVGTYRQLVEQLDRFAAVEGPTLEACVVRPRDGQILVGPRASVDELLEFCPLESDSIESGTSARGRKS